VLEGVANRTRYLVDYAISQSMEPYKNVANKLMTILNEEAYKQKERLVEGLVKALKPGGDQE